MAVPVPKPGYTTLVGLSVQALEDAGGGLYMLHKLVVTSSGCA